MTTSFQGEVLAAELGIPLLSLNLVDRIDLAIDGADEVDPSFQLIKGGGACHVQEKLVAARADRFIVVVDSTKLVDRLNLGFLLPVEVLPGAWRRVQQQLTGMDGAAELRMAQRQAGPVVTDQGNLVLDVRFNGGIADPVALEREINNIPGVLENGLFVNLADDVLVGEVSDGVAGVRSLERLVELQFRRTRTELAWLCSPSLPASSITAPPVASSASLLNSIIEVWRMKVSTLKAPL